MKKAVKYQNLENLDFDEKQPKTSGFIDFSTSNIQISHADACVRCCAGFLLTWCEALSVMMCLRGAEARIQLCQHKNEKLLHLILEHLQSRGPCIRNLDPFKEM